MAIPAGGQISFSQLRSEYAAPANTVPGSGADASPTAAIRISDYYRGKLGAPYDPKHSLVLDGTSTSTIPTSGVIPAGSFRGTSDFRSGYNFINMVITDPRATGLTTTNARLIPDSPILPALPNLVPLQVGPVAGLSSNNVSDFGGSFVYPIRYAYPPTSPLSGDTGPSDFLYTTTESTPTPTGTKRTLAFSTVLNPGTANLHNWLVNTPTIGTPAPAPSGYSTNQGKNYITIYMSGAKSRRDIPWPYASAFEPPAAAPLYYPSGFSFTANVTAYVAVNTNIGVINVPSLINANDVVRVVVMPGITVSGRGGNAISSLVPVPERATGPNFGGPAFTLERPVSIINYGSITPGGRSGFTPGNTLNTVGNAYYTPGGTASKSGPEGPWGFAGGGDGLVPLFAGPNLLDKTNLPLWPHNVTFATPAVPRGQGNRIDAATFYTPANSTPYTPANSVITPTTLQLPGGPLSAPVPGYNQISPYDSVRWNYLPITPAILAANPWMGTPTTMPVAESGQPSRTINGLPYASITGNGSIYGL
jgi:hypothetical protein